MKLKCVVIDDEPVARKGLKEFIAETGILQFEGEANSAMDALPLIVRTQPDILFLDIQMAGISGIEFIREFRPGQQVIFTTAHPGYAVEAYSLEACDYLLKPITYPRFLNAVNRVIKTKNLQPETNSTKGFIFIKTDGRYCKIFHHEIYYIQALQNYVIIQLHNRKYITHVSLSGIEAMLPATDFLKVHKSYIINRNKVETLYGNQVLMNGFEVPLSRSLKDGVKKTIFANRLVE